MICPGCSSENPPGTSFCGYCGRPLPLQCPKCGFVNPADFNFCGRCGADLRERSAPVANSSAGSGYAERRQLTVMFCDIVEATQLSQRLDPEELREVIGGYQRVSATVVSRYAGHVAQYLGDGILVYFGYPSAHEDDAERAIRAGLDIVRAIDDLNVQLKSELSVELAVRIGIHTGHVVVGDIGARREQLALGEATNLAARIQSIAEPGSVVISGTTARLAEGYFAWRDLGEIELKGFSGRVAAYHVLHESGAASRLEAVGGLTPFVGRTHELGELSNSWRAAASVDRQVVVVSGEPGIGKSRLVRSFKERIASEHDHILFESRCSPFDQDSALRPFIETIRTVAQVPAGASTGETRDLLAAMLDAFHVSIDEHLPFLADLLSVAADGASVGPEITPQRRRGRTMHAIASLLHALARQRPVLFVLEDLHWIDPSSLDLLDLIIDGTQGVPLMMLLSCRPEFKRDWPVGASVTVLELTRLSAGQVESMVYELAGRREFPREVMSQIVLKTDGIPLFVEELTKMVLESNLLRVREERYELLGPLPPLAIPTTLHDSLMSRLDRLATVKEVAQIGATIGREFSVELLQRVSRLDESHVVCALDRLVDSGIVFASGDGSGKSYKFRHALIQDAAYESLLRSRRQVYHQQIAETIEEYFPATIGEHPELLAHHYTLAGITRRAILYWELAGQSASERSAHKEAVSHFRRALELIERMPDGPERTEQELAVRVALGAPLMATHGMAAPEVERTYQRAYELCRQVGETPQLFPVRRGLAMYYMVAGDNQRAKEMSEACLELAERFHPEDRMVEAHRVAGPVHVWLGDFRRAEHHLRLAVQLYDDKRHGSHAHVYGQDPRAIALAYLAWVEWFLGYPDTARRTSAQAIAAARSVRSAETLAAALLFASVLHACIGDAALTMQYARETVDLSREQILPMWQALGAIMIGWATADRGEQEEGEATLREGEHLWLRTGAGLAGTMIAGLIAEARIRVATVEEQRAAILRALDKGLASGERFWEAELRRMNGALLARIGPGHADEAEAELRRALNVAEEQGARSLALRSALSLHKLLYALGRGTEGATILNSIAGRFTEGEDTSDLKYARRLLAGAVPGEVLADLPGSNHH